jgi:DNA-binding XRE family transcriptional regulator
MAKLTNEQKREWAKLLYMRENMTQKAIAEKIGISPQSMKAWIDKGNWTKLKNSIILTKSEELSRLHSQLHELNDHIENKPEGQRFPSKAEADILSSLKMAIKAFEGETSIAEIIDVSIEMLEWLRMIDFEKAKELSPLFDQFIKSKLK